MLGRPRYLFPKIKPCGISGFSLSLEMRCSSACAAFKNGLKWPSKHELRILPGCSDKFSDCADCAFWSLPLAHPKISLGANFKRSHVKGAFHVAHPCLDVSVQPNQTKQTNRTSSSRSGEGPPEEAKKT